MGGFNNARYLSQSNRLLSAGRELLTAIQDPAKVANVEGAAKSQTAAELGFRTDPSAGGILADSGVVPEDGLRAILFDLQSASVLIATGLATEEPARDTGHLSQVLDQIEETQAGATAPAVDFLFEAGSVVKSPDVNAAIKSFRADSRFALDRFVSDAVEVLQSVFEQLKKLDPGKIVEAIGNLGKPFQNAVAAGRLVKKGIEKLQNAIKSLLDLLGTGARELQDRAMEVWNKLAKGEYARDILTWAFGVNDTASRIDAILATSNLDTVDLDSASNALRPLADGYESKIKLIKALLSAVVLAAAGLAYFQIAAPWIPLAVAGAYAALVGATVLIGMNYSGSGVALSWVKGVREIAEGIGPATAQRGV